MKKTTKHVIMILACILLLCACSNKKNDSLLIAEVSEGNGFISSDQVDVDLSNKFEIIDSKNTFEYVLDNEKIVGNYVETLISPYYNCNADIYIAKTDGGKEIEFQVNQKTNQVVSYMIAYRNGYTTTENKSYDECLRIAKDKLAEFDKEEYVQVFQETHSKAVSVPECGEVYSYFFRKVYYGKQTTNLVQINVNTDGDVVYVNARDINEFNQKDSELLKDYKQNDELVIEAIKNRVAYGSNKEDIEKAVIEIQNGFYCKLKDGNMYIMYDVLIKSVGSEEYDYVRVLKRL